MPVETMRDIIDYGAKTYKGQSVFRYKVRKRVVSKTYEDVKRDNESVSRILKNMEMLGKHVAVIGPISYEWIISYFGIANSGSVVVPVDVQLPAADVRELPNRADVSALIYDELRADVADIARTVCEGIKYIIFMQSELPKLLTEQGGNFEEKPDKDKLCTISFTSRTTSKSKGVMLTHKNLTDNTTCLDMKIPTGFVSVTLLLIHHAYCLTMDILKGLYIGLTICINDPIMHVSKNTKLFRPEIILLVPMVIESICGKLWDSGGLPPKKMVTKTALGGNLHIICSGGAYLDPGYVGRFQEYSITVLQGYGMAECSPAINTNLEWNCRKESVGKLLPNCEVKVVDEEIWVRGFSVMMGYYSTPEETAEVLEDGWLKTGDLGYVNEDGFVFITGRKKSLIILVNGENVSPEELGSQLSRSPLMKEVLVYVGERGIQAEIFPNLDYAKRRHVKDLTTALQHVVDDYNASVPPFKRTLQTLVRETEFEKTSSKKIKRNQSNT